MNTNSGSRSPRRHWSAPVYTRINPLLCRLLESRWHSPTSRRVVVLDVTGRRTGRRYRICVGYARDGRDAIDILVSDASNRTWWRNFLDGAALEVVLRGERRRGYAHAYRPAQPEFKVITDRSIQRITGRKGPDRFFAVQGYDPDAGFSTENLEALADFAVAVRVELEPGT